MTDYTATPEQWADAEHYGNPERQPRPIGEYACILELRARIEALEVVHFKPPSLKEQALAALKRLAVRSVPSLLATEDCDTIRRALEALPND